MQTADCSLSQLDFVMCYAAGWILISAPSLGVIIVNNLTLSVCPDVPLSRCVSVTNFKLLLLFLFIDGIEPFLAVSSPWAPLQNYFSSIFDLGPLTPKIDSPKFAQNRLYKSVCMAYRPEMFGHTRGFSGMADSMAPCKMLWGRPLLPRQRHLG